MDTDINKGSVFMMGRPFAFCIPPNAGITPAIRAANSHLYAGLYLNDYIPILRPSLPLTMSVSDSKRVIVL